MNLAHTELLENILRCPSCGGGLKISGSKWKCTNCSTSGQTDRYGILHLCEDDYYYREVPRSFFAPILAQKKEGICGFDIALNQLDEKGRDYILNYALNPNRGGAVVLACVGEGTLSLDYGSGWGNLTRAISFLGGTVVSMDMTYESLVFSKQYSSSPREIYIRGGQHYPLPYNDNRFDNVFLNGVLEWLPEGFMLEKNPREVQKLFVREFLRVLKPGGRLVIGIENRHGIYYWLGKKEDHTNLRFGALLPRSLADLYSRLVRKKPYRTYTYTMSGYLRLLRKFEDVKFFVPLPRYRTWSILLPADRMDAIDVFRKDVPRSFVHILRAALFGLLQKLKISAHLANDYYIKADKPSDEVQTKSLVQTIIEASGDREEKLPALQLSSTHILNFSSDLWFYKLPLDKRALERTRREIKVLKELRGDDLAEYLPAESEFRKASGAAFAKFSLIKGTRNIRVAKSADQHLLLTFVRNLHAGAYVAELQGTHLWKRLNDESFIKTISKISCTNDFKEIFSHMGEMAVSAGRTHGDLCAQNMLVQRGTLYVVDWDRYEDFSPLFLDLCHFWVKEISRQGKNIAPFDVDFLKGNFLSSALLASTGELSIKEVARIYYWDRIAKDVSSVENPDHLPAFWWNYYRKALKLLG